MWNGVVVALGARLRKQLAPSLHSLVEARRDAPVVSTSLMSWTAQRHD
jgi:hypothetical protein